MCLGRHPKSFGGETEPFKDVDGIEINYFAAYLYLIQCGVQWFVLQSSHLWHILDISVKLAKLQLESRHIEKLDSINDVIYPLLFLYSYTSRIIQWSTCQTITKES